MGENDGENHGQQFTFAIWIKTFMMMMIHDDYVISEE